MAIQREKVVAAAQKYIQKGQYKKAIKEYQRIVAEQPDDVRTLQKIGDLQGRDGDIEGAVVTYNEVADHYVASGFFLKAVAVYKQLLRIAPQKLEARLRLADLYVQLSLLRDALQNYQEVAERYLELGWIEAYLGTLERIVEVDPESASNRIRFGEQLLKYEHPDAAAEQFAAASMQLYEMERFEEYAKVAERYIHLVPGDAAAVHRLARVYLDQGRPKRAIARVQSIYRANPSDAVALDLLIEAFDAMGERSRALATLMELARAFEADGASDGRRLALEAVLRLEPAHLEAAAALGRSAATPAAPSGAEGTPAAATVGGALTPEQETAVAKLLSETDVYLKYDLYDKALEHLASVFAIAPYHLEALERRKSALVAKGDSELAVQVLIGMARIVAPDDAVEANLYLHQALAIVPDHPNVLAVLGELESGVPAEPLIELDPVVVAVEEASTPPPPVEDASHDELDALFTEFTASDSGVGHRALDEDSAFISDVESSIDGAVGHVSPTNTSSNLIALDSEDMLPADLDEALERVDEATSAGDIDSARAQLFELLGEWPGHDELLLQRMDALPSSAESGARMPGGFAEDVEVAPLASESGFAEAVDEDLFLLDDEVGGPAAAGLEDLNGEAPTGAMAAVIPGPDGQGRITGSFDTTTAGAFIAEVLDSGNVAALEDGTDLDGIEIVIDDWDDDDVAEFEVVDDAVLTDLREVAVDAPAGQPSDSVTRSFSPSEAVLQGGDTALSVAIRQRRAGNGMSALTVLQEELVGDHPVAASFELALANMEMGLYVDGIKMLERLLGDPTMVAADRTLVHYHIGLGFEALHQPHDARRHLTRVFEADSVGFPDVRQRLARLEA